MAARARWMVVGQPTEENAAFGTNSTRQRRSRPFCSPLLPL